MVSAAGISLFDGMYEGLGNALDLVKARQQLTAANIVNVDTPGYRARELLPFRELLGEVMEKGVSGGEVNVNDRIESSISELAPPDYALDGNSVDVEREHTMMEENKVFYQAVVGGMSRRLAMLKFAASDGKG